MPPEDAFLRAILADPDDDAPRLIYADWLDENGDSDRAEFIRLQIALAAGAKGDPRRPELTRRERQLLGAHGREWAAPVAGKGLSWTFRRGFIEGVNVAAPTFLSRAADLFAAAPIRHVRLVSIGPNAPRLAACPALARVASLDLAGCRPGPGQLAVLLASPYLTRLETLNLRNDGLWSSGVEVLVQSRVLASLTRLELGNNQLHDAGAVRLAACPRLTRLRRLGLRWNGIGNAGAVALATSPHLSGIVTLDLRHNYVGDQGSQVLRERLGERVRL